MKLILLIPLLLASFFSLAEITYSELDLFDQARQRPVKISVWYQAGSDCQHKLCLAQANKSAKVKLALVSHGAFGSPREMRWLGDGLAKQDWLVIGVAHYGESWVYGKSSVDYSIVSKKWLRAQDISFVLDQFFQSNSLINAELDQEKLIVVGHSLGGYSALSLAGVVQDPKAMLAYCQKAIMNDKGCRYGKPNKGNKSSLAATRVEVKDERIKALVLLDPALGPLVTRTSLQQLALPTFIAGSVDNDFLDYQAHAGYYADSIQGAQLLKLTKGEGHFIYLDECQHQHQVMATPLCQDRPGIDRTKVHSRLIAAIKRFTDGL